MRESIIRRFERPRAIVAKITAETMDKLKEVVRSHVRRIDKIQSTTTMIVTEEAPS